MKISNQPSGQDIQAMFDRLAPSYDRFNQMVSLGQDRIWREEVLKNVKEGSRILDVGCGTGDLTLGAARRMRAGEVVGLDFSSQMIAIAQKRADRLANEHPYYAPVRFVCDSAENLPLEKKPFDLVVSGFVLRNIYEKIDRVMEGIHRSLKDGGRVALVDFTEPPGSIRNILWKTYMNTAGALCGRIAFGRDYPGSYLTDSAKRFLKPDEFCATLRHNGFMNIKLKRFMMGIIVLYEAEKA